MHAFQWKLQLSRKTHMRLLDTHKPQIQKYIITWWIIVESHLQWTKAWMRLTDQILKSCSEKRCRPVPWSSTPIWMKRTNLMNSTVSHPRKLRMKMKRNNYLQTILMDKMDLVRALKIQMRMRKTIMIQSRNAWRLSRRNSKNKS